MAAGKLMKVVNCRDVGVDCDFVAKGETIEDVIRQCDEHAQSAHGANEMPSELLDQVRSAIREDDTTAVAKT